MTAAYLMKILLTILKMKKKICSKFNPKIIKIKN